jgi:hypothetical protein
MNEISKRAKSGVVRFVGSAIITSVLFFSAGTTRAQIQPGQTSLPPDQQQAEPQQNQVLSSQPAPAARNLDPSTYEPITMNGRVRWWVRSLIGPESLAAGVFVAGYQTARNQPSVWGTHWDGFGKRYGMRMSNIAVSNAIQGGVGSIWGEDPRYFRSGESSMGGRLRHVAMGVFEAKYRDGNYGPNVSYYIGSVSGNFISNAWRPSEQTTTGATMSRVGTGVLGKLVSNAFKEFWPDVQEHVFHRGQ